MASQKVKIKGHAAVHIFALNRGGVSDSQRDISETADLKKDGYLESLTFCFKKAGVFGILFIKLLFRKGSPARPKKRNNTDDISTPIFCTNHGTLSPVAAVTLFYGLKF